VCACNFEDSFYVNNVQTFCSYITENTVRVHYKEKINKALREIIGV